MIAWRETGSVNVKKQCSDHLILYHPERKIHRKILQPRRNGCNQIFREDKQHRKLHNLISISFSQPQLDVLSLGWDFKIQSKKMDQLQEKCQFTNSYDQLKDHTPTSSDNEGWLRAKLVDISHSYLTAPMQKRCCLIVYCE